MNETADLQTTYSVRKVEFRRSINRLERTRESK